MRKFITLFFALTAMLSWGWSQKGHDVTAAIAERHLTPKAKAAVDSLLGGRSMIYWANWLDNASHTPEYKYTKTWHYKNVNDGVRYEEMAAHPAGDAVTAIKSSLEKLNDSTTSTADKELALKILIHVTGDIHQPMHMGHATDLGGNRVKVKFFGRDANLHSVWDGSIVESGHKWSYTEWVEQLDRVSPEVEQSYTAGTVDDWAKQSVAIAKEIYNAMPPGTDIGYDEVARWTPIIENQLLAAGLRLASLLNATFAD